LTRWRGAGWGRRSARTRGWEILAACFEPRETGLQTKLTDQFWPKKA